MKLLRALRSVRRRHLVVPAAVAAIVLTASVPAWAGDQWPDEGWVITPPPLAAPAPTAPPKAEPERRWYGWQLITTDSLAAPAVIHIAHGRAGIAAASFGLRLGLPSAGVLLGAGAVSRSRPPSARAAKAASTWASARSSDPRRFAETIRFDQLGVRPATSR
jgi:hypothetical protein